MHGQGKTRRSVTSSLTRLASIARTLKFWRVRWAGHMESMGGKGNVCKILGQETSWKIDKKMTGGNQDRCDGCDVRIGVQLAYVHVPWWPFASQQRQTVNFEPGVGEGVVAPGQQNRHFK